jgi:hypothetical protein
MWRCAGVVGVALAHIGAGPGALALVRAPTAVIDASLDVRPFVAQLQASGVAVVGRYLGRCPQWAGKRLIDNGARSDPDSEVSRLLAAGIGVLSIYQYLSNHPRKFDGLWLDPRDNQVKALPTEDCARPADPPHTLEQEADLDGRAAVAQARALGQPRGSAIYFGIDFNVDRADAALVDKVTAYVRHTSAAVKAAGYRYGAYGSGSAHLLLEGLRHTGGALNRQPLVDYFWLSAARGHSGSAAYFDTGRWHLLQTVTDIRWYRERADGTCADGLELDPDIINPRFAGRDIGFWGARGSQIVPAARTRQIAARHRFVCNGVALLRAAPDAAAPAPAPLACGPAFVDCDNASNAADRPQDPRPRLCYASVVQVGRTQGGFVEVDDRGSGRVAGWTRRANVTADFSRRPAWIGDRTTRRAATCP